MTLPIIPTNAVVSHQGKIQTTSLKVAEAFQKQHKDVLRKLESLDYSQEFASANFSANVQKVSISRAVLLMSH